MGNQTLRSLLLWGQNAAHHGGNYRANFIWDCVRLNDSPEVVAAAKAVQEADREASKKYTELLEALESKAAEEDPRIRVVEILDELDKIHEAYGETTWIHVGLPALYLERLAALPALDRDIAVKVSAFTEQLRAYSQNRGKDERGLESDKPRSAIFMEVDILKNAVAESFT